jgi:hypothetical protein
MTPDEIDKMVAGHDMDVLISENIMGWVPRKLNSTLIEKRTYDGWWVEKESKGYLIPKHYSTDIAEAWKVAEMFPYATVMFDAITWSCKLNDGEREFYGGSDIENPTAPLAICRAALKAAIASKVIA